MMKKLLLVALMGAFALPAAALAADLRMPYKAPPPPIPAFSWTGLYIGANGGCGASRQTINNFNTADGGADFFGDFTSDGGGCFGGGQVGYNYQFANWVIGVEADGSWGSIKGQGVLLEDGGTEASPFHTNVTSLGTVRGRIGYAFNFGSTPILPYFTAGWGWARNQVSVFTPFTSDTQTPGGLAIGGGVEFALSQNWSFKAEYMYFDLGSKNYNVTFDGDPGVAPGANLDLKIQTVKAGLNYKLDWFRY
jgi:outer membrane immunogenic protein